MPPSTDASIDHFLFALQLNSLSQPASNISNPAQAIIAALSVHKSRGGKTSCTCEYPFTSKQDRRLQLISDKERCTGDRQSKLLTLFLETC
jgi:hypothetical protein